MLWLFQVADIYSGYGLHRELTGARVIRAYIIRCRFTVSVDGCYDALTRFRKGDSLSMDDHLIHTHPEAFHKAFVSYFQTTHAARNSRAYFYSSHMHGRKWGFPGLIRAGALGGGGVGLESWELGVSPFNCKPCHSALGILGGWAKNIQMRSDQ